MAQSVSFGSLVDPEEEAIKRQRAYADALRMQSMEPMGATQMAGGVAVRNSPLQGLAKMLQSYTAAKSLEDADKRQAGLLERRSGEAANDMGALIKALRGSPAQSFQTGANEMGDDAATQTLPAQPPDSSKALEIAMRSKSPMIQGLAPQFMAGMLPKPAKWEKFERPDGKGGKESGYVDINSPDPLSTFKSGGLMPAKREYVNGQGVNPYTGETQGAAIPKQLSPDSVVTMGPGGVLQPNQAVIAAKKDIARAGASSTNVSVNTANKPMLNEIGKGVGEQVVNDFGGARSAAQVLNNVQQIEGALKNVITGPAANVRIKLSQIGEVLGVNGKDATEQLQNTRQVVQGLARQEMAAAAGMKGQGQITESERGILRRAESGQIDEMTVPEIKTLLGALRKTSQYRITLHNQNLERLKKDPNAAGVVDYMKVDVPGGGSVLDAADAIIRGGNGQR